MRKVIEQFKNFMNIGSHCESTALRNLMDYYGFHLSEDMCLGLGGGIGFLYIRYSALPIAFFNGRCSDLIEDCCNSIGFKYLLKRSFDNQLAWEAVKQEILADNPVILTVDMKYLDYLNEIINITDYPFGGHRLVIVGFDEENNEAILADYLWREFKTVALEVLAQARSAHIPPFAPENCWVALRKPEQIIPLQQAIYHAIRVCVHHNLYSFGIGMGLKGIRKFVNEVLKWPSLLDEEKLKQNCNGAFFAFEKIGTGGGNFRRMFSRFLKEAQEICKNQSFHEAAKIYNELSKRWKELAFLLQESGINPGQGLFQNKESSEKLLEEIYTQEKNGLEVLAQIIQ